jgi:hypothetical protein
MCHRDSLLRSRKSQTVPITSTCFETYALEPDQSGRDDRYTVA